MATDTAATERRRLGVFGGAFDPVHAAHVALARAAMAQFQLESVTLVPSGNPPHRTLSSTSDEHRVAMLNLAIAGYNGLSIDEWELKQTVTTYTYDTLKYLCSSDELEYFFLMGEDSLRQFTTWQRWESILEMCHLCVARRTPESQLTLPAVLEERVVEFGADQKQRAGNIYFIELSEMPISATAIRRRLAAGDDSVEQLNPIVKQYIRENRLYRNA